MKSRSITILILAFSLSVIPCSASVFDYGVATRGPLELLGNIAMDGTNVVVEGDVYIESNNQNEALSIIGNSQIVGDVFITNPDGYVTLQGGQAGIGGETGDDALNHVSVGVSPIEFPVPNPNYFEHYVQNTFDPAVDDTTLDNTYENIRIPGGTNPTFSGSTTLNGIVFIESPNIVTFTGNVDITGIIVGDGGMCDNSGTNQIIFLGNISNSPVSDLPDEPQFDQLRDETGTFLIAPGFSASFGGSFDTLNGTIAANGINFFGNAGGTINGSIINYSDTPMTLSSNSDLFLYSSGFNNSHAFLQSPIPTPPVADADGPYNIYVDDMLTLDASASTDGDNDIVSYMWDLDDNGNFETNAGGQAIFDVNYEYLESLGLLVDNRYNIHLLVTDSNGQCDINDSTFTVYTCQEQIGGDLNGDCIVNMVDFAMMSRNWLEKGYVRISFSPLDTSPNWIMEGQWEFGAPTGNGGTENGNPDPSSGYTGSNVYGVNLNGDYTVAVGGPYCLIAGPFDCNQFHDMKLRFARWLNTDELGYVESKIDVSNDGANWHTLWENTAAITDSNWQVVEYDASETADNEEAVYFRWSYKIMDRAYPYSGWNVDDIELLGKF